MNAVIVSFVRIGHVDVSKDDNHVDVGIGDEDGDVCTDVDNADVGIVDYIDASF